jgi:hypothetical protein
MCELGMAAAPSLMRQFKEFRGRDLTSFGASSCLCLLGARSKAFRKDVLAGTVGTTNPGETIAENLREETF